MILPNKGTKQNILSQKGRSLNNIMQQDTNNQEKSHQNRQHGKHGQKQLEEMFRVPKNKKNHFPLYLDEERDDFFMGCTFEDGLEDIGNRELSHLEWVSVAPPPGKYRPKWSGIDKNNRMLVDYQLEAKNRFNYEQQRNNI